MTFVLLYLLALLAIPVFSAPTFAPSVVVIESLDDQLPNVARINYPYSWTFSNNTFCSTDGPLNYTASAMPAWLAFDGDARTFYGTPGANDTGFQDITVTAHGAGSSVSSRFSLCVSPSPPLAMGVPLADQFAGEGAALSSVFALQPASALAPASQAPALRIPRRWSFSVGFAVETFVSPAGRAVFYDLRMADGGAVPEYMSFDARTATLDGAVPALADAQTPLALDFALHASDEEGYTDASAPFTLVLADHELSARKASMPTINVTANDAFVVSLLAPADFTGILVDGADIQPSNISTLAVDVSAHSWLRYDAPSRTLSGTPANLTDVKPVLPVNLTTIFNQTIQTRVALALVEPYFVVPTLPALNVSKGDDVALTLSNWVSATADAGAGATTVSATFSPVAAANFLRYDADTTQLTGTIPSDFSAQADQIGVTFTAYSHISHSTSHTRLEIYVPGAGANQAFEPPYPNSLSTEAHRRLVLGLVLTFGIIGGMCVLAGIFALVRRCSHVPDTAVTGEEGRVAWSEKDRRWYGLTLSPRGTRVVERADRVFNEAPGGAGEKTDALPVPGPQGLGLRRVSERSQLEEEEEAQQQQQQQRETAAAEAAAAAVITKREFLARIKQTVRQVSDKYNSVRRQRAQAPVPPASAQLVIGKPILVASTRPAEGIPAGPGAGGEGSPSLTGDDHMLPPSRPASTFMTGSPSGSTGEHSIPRRRADFVPPKPAAVHFGDGLLARQASTGSMGGTSFQSGLSGEGESVLSDLPMGPHTKPRLVPFTHSTRVPTPLPLVGGAGAGAGMQLVPGNRIASQRAKVVDSGEAAVKHSSTGDELSMGMHYVRSLGADPNQLGVLRGAGTGTGSPAGSALRSSFTSLESSGRSGGEGDGVMKVLLRAGERFKFRVPVPAGARARAYDVRLTSGQALPRFVQPDLSGIAAKGVIELAGVPTFRDIGEMTVGIYADGACVASVIIEVVGKR